MRKLLIICQYFYPGYKAGGPIQSIKNICDHLQNNFDIYVLTGDRDFEDKSSYPGIHVNGWNSINSYKVFYAKKKKISLVRIIRIIRQIRPDIIYLNSFFYVASIQTLLLNTFFQKKIVLAPRGELHPGAIGIRKQKKMLYLYLSRLFIPKKYFIFHATDLKEKEDIHLYFKKVKVFLIGNIIKNPTQIAFELNFSQDKFKIVYLSRINPKKNLYLFIECLKELKIKKEIIFDIYGIIDDPIYWKRCLTLIKEICRQNPGLKIEHKGDVRNDSIFKLYQSYNLFVLLTKGENFGHAIYESLASGLPVLISIYTPWRNLEKSKCGYDVELNKNSIVSKLNCYISMDINDQLEWRKNSFNYALHYYSTDESVKKTINMFNTI